ncbi:MAG: cation:proton antiporter [Spirochaetes bacterium]|nr:cation:proton antiporter [Spirochaetota bacterium]
MNIGNTYFEIAVILGIAAILGIIGQRLKQPLIIMFLAAGILAGPSGFGIIESYKNIELLAHIGIALLLFIVGLKLDLKLIRNVGAVALATGLGQIIFTSAFGFLIALILGIPAVSAVYVSVALTFSSTIIVVKLLSDKKEIDSLHGQIALGFLIVQDIAAIIAMVGLTTFGTNIPGSEAPALSTLIIIAKGTGFLLAIIILTRYCILPLTKRMSQSQELLALFAVSWAVILGASAEILGFTKELGAFAAGISLAATEYRDAIGTRLAGLRDFLLLFFFIDLGAKLDLSTVGEQMGSSAVFSVFVLIGNPLIVLVIMGLMGFRRRTGFLAGLTVAQISEFSLIVAAMGLSLGHITPEIMGLITLVGVITIFLSTYMILYSGSLYRLISGPLKIFEKKDPYREKTADTFKDSRSVDAVLVGLGNFGSQVAEILLRRNKTVIGVDFDPDVLEKWNARGMSVLYGDMADPEMHEHLPLDKAKWIINTARIMDLNLAMLSRLKKRKFSGKIALTAVNQEEAESYANAGADVVFRPFIDAAEQAVDSMTQAMDMISSDVDWPISFMETRIRPGAVYAGKQIRDIPLRSATGVSILAVMRSGRVNYDPDPDFLIYPGDRLVIMGPASELKSGESMLNETAEERGKDNAEHFKVDEISIGSSPEFLNKTFAGTRFRQRYGATVVGIRRNGTKITSPSPDEMILKGDSLIIVGSAAQLQKIKAAIAAE